MHPCPVCQRQIESLRCPDCGFDGSRDCEHYPTLAKVPDQTESIMRRKEYRKDLLYCPDCRHGTFSFSIPQASFTCLQCGKIIRADAVMSHHSVEKADNSAPQQISKTESKQPSPGGSSKFANLQFGKNYESVPAPAAPASGNRSPFSGLGLSKDAENQLLKFAGDLDIIDSLLPFADGLSEPVASKIIAVSAGGHHTMALYDDGTVSSTPSVWDNEDNMKDWTDVVSISTDTDIFVGLRKDGTVLVDCGNIDILREAEKWTDLIAVSASHTHIIGLKKDGTVLAAGKNKFKQCNVSQWTDISAVSTDVFHTVGLRKDGSILIAGDVRRGGRAAKSWQNMAAISAGTDHIVGLRQNGTVIASGDNEFGQCNVQDWTDICAVAAGLKHTVALRKDGTVLAVGRNGNGQCSVENWTEIVAIAAGSYHTVGLKKDGTLVATGDDLFNQCSVSWIRHR